MEPSDVVVILADDLIWSTRLADLVTATGREPRPVRSLGDFGAALDIGRAAIIDLTARAYDGIAAVEMAEHVRARILCVGQHDDLELRKRALAAGADRVLPYRVLFERGAAVLGRWLESRSDDADETLPPGGDG
jgi:hypothetical protein